MIRFIDEIKPEELQGKKVLVRVNFDVPVNEQGEIAESFRVKSHAETIGYLLSAGAKVALVSHIDSLPGFGPLTEQIGEILGQTITLVPLAELDSLPMLFESCSVLLIDNIRQDPREEANDSSFAEELSAGFDFYVNDAFAASYACFAGGRHQNSPLFCGVASKKRVALFDRSYQRSGGWQGGGIRRSKNFHQIAGGEKSFG